MLFDTYLPPAVLHLNHEAANYFPVKGKEGQHLLVATYQAALIQAAALFQDAAQRQSASSQPASCQPESSQPATSQAAVESQAAASNLWLIGIQVPTYLHSITSIFLASKA